QPLFWAALVFAAGIWFGRYAWRPPLWWIAGALVLLIAATYYRHARPRIAPWLAYGALVFVGSLAMQVSSGAGGEVWLGDGQPVMVTAHITTEGAVEPDGTGSNRQRLDVETERIESAT